jgi:hypothetical protein
LIDLFLVSVLLDAGAGTVWSYKSKENGKVYRRSEGLAVASLEMFKAGMFSSNPDNAFQVDSEGLKRLTVESMGKALQVSESNPIAGLEGRANLLIRLADALKKQLYFGADARPGNMLGNLFPAPKQVFKSWTNMHRLSHLSSNNPSFLCPCRSSTDPLVRPHGWSLAHLACLPHSSRRRIPR